ncbi:MAG: hypothetical protein ACLP9L_05060 [Thermoguttaceae bacterium]
MSATLTRGESVAKTERGRPSKPGGQGRPVRIDPELFNKARIVAMRRGSQIGEYLGTLIEGPVNRDYQRVLKELASEAQGGGK